MKNVQSSTGVSVTALGRQAHVYRYRRVDVTGFGLADPKLLGEREAVRQLLAAQPANRPPAGSAIVADKALAGADIEAFLADLELLLIRPARSDEPQPRLLPSWLRQRIEAIIWTLKRQLGLEQHGGRVPAGLWVRVVQRLLALNTAIWHNWPSAPGQALPDRLPSLTRSDQQ